MELCIHFHFLLENFQNKDSLSCPSRLCVWFYFHILHNESHFSANKQPFPYLHSPVSQSCFFSSKPLDQLFLPLPPPPSTSLLSSSLLPVWRLSNPSPEQKVWSLTEISLNSMYSRCTRTHTHTYYSSINPSLFLPRSLALSAQVPRRLLYLVIGEP